MSDGIYAFRDRDEGDFDVFCYYDEAHERCSDVIASVVEEHGSSINETDFEIWKLDGVASRLPDGTICLPLSLSALDRHCEVLKDNEILNLKEIVVSQMKLIEEALCFLENAPFCFKNGVEHNGIDEGDVLGSKYMLELIDKIKVKQSSYTETIIKIKTENL